MKNFETGICIARLAHAYLEILLVRQAAQTAFLAMADSSQIRLHMSRSIRNPNREVLDRDVLVELFLVVALEDRELVHGTRMHHRLGDRPQRGKDPGSVRDEGLVHCFGVVVRRHRRHRLQILDERSTRHAVRTWKRRNHVHADALEVLDAAQTLELARLRAELVEQIDTPLQGVDVVVDPLLDRTRNDSVHVHRAQKTNVHEVTLLVFLVVVARVVQAAHYKKLKERNGSNTSA